MNTQMFVWQPRRTRLDHARQRITHVLNVTSGRLTRAYGHEFHVRCTATDVAIICTLGSDSETPTSNSWLGNSAAGAACIGAIEGPPRPEAPGPDARTEPPRLEPLRDALLGPHTSRTAIEALRDALALPGRWSLAAWRPGEVVVVNGASTGRSFWWTEGPDGWAVGTQPRTLLELVDRPKRLDLDSVTLMIAFGYVAGWKGLYEDTHRLGPGERIAMRALTPPIVDRPATLDAVLGSRVTIPYDELVGAFAGRVTQLVTGEIAASAHPHISLSGGRDSRLLAAAAVRGGFRPLTTTGGPATSPDVVLARQVAGLLGLRHTAHADARPADTPTQRQTREETGGVGRGQEMTMARLATWIDLSDGTAPMSLAWVSRDLSRPVQPTAMDTQALTGLGGGTHRGAYFSSASDLDRPGTARRGRGLVLDMFAMRLPLRRPVRELLAAEIDATDGLLDTTLPLSEWLTRFQWRFRDICRGSDALERSDLANWTWAPLMDAGLLALSREAPAASLRSSRFVEDATLRLAPQLAGVPYDRKVMSTRPEWMLRFATRHGFDRAARRLRSWLQREHRPARSRERNARLEAFWEELYFGRGDHVWPELIDPLPLRRTIHREPDGQLVKALAVPELLLRADHSRERS